MLFWHVGGVLLLFRYIFRDPKVDVRWLTFGAVLPNLIDKPLGTIVAPDYFGTDRLIGHTLLFATAIMVAALISTRRGRRRRAWLAVAIGTMLHLVLDGMWTAGATLFWPFLGSTFAPGVADYWSGFVGQQLLEPATVVQEVAGLSYLIYLWRKSGLNDPMVRRRLLADGRLSG